MFAAGLLFFTTYTLLVLFWAEIYHQARSMPTASLRPTFIGLNALVYAIQVCFSLLDALLSRLRIHATRKMARAPAAAAAAVGTASSTSWAAAGMLLPLLLQGALWAYESSASSEAAEHTSRIVGATFLAAVSVSAAAGFLLYGGRLFLMLQRFPIESRGRKKKLREVGLVTSICAACFGLRALMVAASALDSAELDLDVIAHPLSNAIYYSLVEVLPSAWVLYILRKLPPKRSSAGYTSIPAR